MSTPDPLGSFEQLVLLALVRLGDDAYGMTVRREITERAGREVSLGAVYATLTRLERKGLVRSHAGSTASARGGRARRFFRIGARGAEALRLSLESLDRLRAGLPDLRPGGLPDLRPGGLPDLAPGGLPDLRPGGLPA